MRTRFWMTGLVAIALFVTPAGADDSGKKFHDAAFARFEGAQSWPVGDKAEVISDFAVPIYMGLPTKPYTVLGRVYDDRTSGIGIMTRAFSEGLFSERDRQRDCADQAKFRGGDALLVTSDERVIKALGVSRDSLSKTAPLFQHKDSAVLVIKFE